MMKLVKIYMLSKFIESMALVILLASSNSAMANKVPVSLPDFSQPAYPTLIAAALAAEQAAKSCSNAVVECEGVLYQSADGGYHYTLPAGDGLVDATNVRSFIPAHATLKGTYHDHPASNGAISEYASQADLNVAKQTAVPMFIGIYINHTVIEYISGVDKIQLLSMLTLGNMDRVSAGRVVGVF